MSAHDIVSRLDHCRQSGRDKWLARCPAHDDRSPSLSIRDIGDGRTLINCFAGCGAVDVLAAIGLELSDLYPPTDRHHYASTCREEEKALDELVVEIAEADRAAGKEQTEADLDRELEARIRLHHGEPSPEVGDAEALFLAQANRLSKKNARHKKNNVIRVNPLANQTKEEWLAEYFGDE